MWIVVLLALGVVVTLWQVILAGLILWALVACIRWWIAAAAEAKPIHTGKPVQSRPEVNHRRKPAQNRPEVNPRPKPVQTRPGDVPAPDYLPRWTASRRLETDLEHALWQEAFDRQGVSSGLRRSP
ncbi:MAG TPA: hypothetical protein VF885_15295 [Arthrobacter sp.]